MVLSYDTSSCSCIFVALPPPSDAVFALCWCVSAPVMRAAVCLPHVSAVKHRRVAVLHLCHSRHSLAVSPLLCCCCVLSACFYVHAVAVVVFVTCATVAVSLRSGMTASRTCGLSGCVVFGVTRTRCCA